jgi:hypothetical protein
MLMSKIEHNTPNIYGLLAEATRERRAGRAIAAMDAEAAVAMADSSAAAALLRDETLTLPKKERRALQRRCKEASFRVNALHFAMRVGPARTKRGLLAQIRQLGEAALDGDTDQAEHLVAVIRAGVESLVSDDS